MNECSTNVLCTIYYHSMCTYLIIGGVMPPNPNMAADDASLIAFQSKLLITVKKWKNSRSNSIEKKINREYV